LGDVASPVVVRNLGLKDYTTVWRDMQQFSKSRNINTADEFWVVQHPPVFTQGTNSKTEHLLNVGNIPVVQIDRGGQVTYHGPGQQIIYLLLNLRERNLGVRTLVSLMEDAIIATLGYYGIEANNDPKAPGVYVNKRKIAALGLRVSRGCTTHGLSLNIDMDLEPFSRINPCGYKGLQITQCKDLGITESPDVITERLLTELQQRLLPV